MRLHAWRRPAVFARVRRGRLSAGAGTRRLAAMACLAGLLAGCSIRPGPVIEQGRAPSDDQQFSQNYSDKLVRPDRVGSAKELVERFLIAAADNPATREQTLRSYLDNGLTLPRRGSELNVIRVNSDDIKELAIDQGITPVEVTLQKVGVLREGAIVPVFESPRKHVFHTVNRGSAGYFLEDVPDELMLWDRALSDQFILRPIYFWDKQFKRLVPDYRYLPKYLLSDAERSRQLIDWLFGPLTPWMAGAVSPPLAQARPSTNPGYAPDGTLLIDLPNPVPQLDLDRLATQLESTLVAGAVTGVQLKIQGQEVSTSKISPPVDPPPLRYGVLDGRVVRLAVAAERRDVPLPEAVAALDKVSWVAFSRRETAVAMWQANRFLLGPSGNPQPVNLAARQAMWLDGRADSAIVLADGDLHEVTVAGAITKLPIPISGDTEVSSFSIMPDGRIALVINGELMVAMLWRNESGSLVLSHPQQVPTGLSQVKEVAFARRSQLAITGNDSAGEILITLISPDGSQQANPEQSRYASSQEISQLVADRYWDGIYYNYLGAAYQAQPGNDEKIPLDQAAQPASSPPPSTPAAGRAIVSVSFEG